MKVTSINFGDIILKEKRKFRKEGLFDLEFHWGLDGFNALNEMYSLLVCSKHFLSCDVFCDSPGKELTDKDLGVRFMGNNHYWDIKKRGYSVSVK